MHEGWPAAVLSRVRRVPVMRAPNKCGLDQPRPPLMCLTLGALFCLVTLAFLLTKKRLPLISHDLSFMASGVLKIEARCSLRKGNA